MIEIVDVTDNDLVDMARIESASIVHESRSDGYAPSIEELISLWGNRFLFKSHKRKRCGKRNDGNAVAAQKGNYYGFVH